MGKLGAVVWDNIKKFLKNKDGGFAIMFSVCLSVLIFAVAAAVELSSMVKHKQKSQNYADLAALAAARYMTDHVSELGTEANFNKYKNEAQKIAEIMIQTYMDEDVHLSAKPTFHFSDTDVRVDLNVTQKPLMMDMVGKKVLTHNVTASANLAIATAKDVDIALISDATGSMATTLTAIQTNMKDFTFDLQLELDKYDIKLGNVRVKFLFYRDYMVDNHMDWTGKDMTPLSGLELYGPMYESQFFELPGDKADMDNYVDFFQAGGGGTFKESGFEAIWNAYNSSDWGSGEDTVRSIVLWTDATPRPLGDHEEVFGLTPKETGYWSNTYWTEKMGSTFAAMTYEQRQTYMIDNYYPEKMPKTRSALQSKFEEFHAENANGKPDVKTMTINIVSDCWGTTPCGEWEDVKAWEGVDVFEESTVSSTETYDMIVKQVADTVLSQLSARDLALTH